jgi:hypothetical protein
MILKPTVLKMGWSSRAWNQSLETLSSHTPHDHRNNIHEYPRSSLGLRLASKSFVERAVGYAKTGHWVGGITRTSAVSDDEKLYRSKQHFERSFEMTAHSRWFCERQYWSAMRRGQ